MTEFLANALWAGIFLDELARSGVKDLCVAPGSRSTPLVLAAARDGRFRMFSVVDERSAGFFALGLGKASGWPAGVITTSGTAAANLYPAVIEASQGEIPLLLFTADRPPHLRDTDGNQAMDQLRLFGAFPRAFFEVELPRLEGPPLRHLRSLAARAVSLAVGPSPGPVHLNFPFEKPLEPPPGWEGPSSERPLEDFLRDHPRAGPGRPGDEAYVRIPAFEAAVVEEEAVSLRTLVEGAIRGVIVAGPVPEPWRVGPAVLALGAATGFPVLADPLSGARFAPPQGARVVGGYDLFLRSAEARKALDPDLILRIGGSPTSSGALEYLAGAFRARQVVVDGGFRWKDHLASANDYFRVSPARLLERLAGEVLGARPNPGWLERWAEAEERTRSVLTGLDPVPLLEGDIARTVVEEIPEGGNLLVASSMPVRDLDAFGFPGPRSVRVFGNRGVSGIDGLVSTALGIAMAADPAGLPGGMPSLGGAASRPTVALLGDLAFYHDMNGLLATRALRPRLVLVVVNNDGGGIFHTLPVRDHDPTFMRFFATPHGLDFQHAATLYEIPHSRSESLEAFRFQLAQALERDGPSILEVRTRRTETHRRREEVLEAVVRAFREFGAPSAPGVMDKENSEDESHGNT